MNGLEQLLPEPGPPPGTPSIYRFGEVTSVSPLRVKLDGDTVAIPVAANTFGPVIEGDRVWCQIHGTKLLLIGAPAAARRDLEVRNMAGSFMGGGRRTASATAVAWDTRIMLMGNGRDPVLIPGGYIAINKPADGTVIPIYGAKPGFATSATVASGLVPLGDWHTLWYDVAPGLAEADRWAYTDYWSDYTVPPTWVRVVTRYNDGAAVVWGDGRETGLWNPLSLAAGWVNYGGYTPARYRVENGVCFVQMMIKAGTATNGTGIATLPAGARPGYRIMGVGQSYTSPNSTLSRIDINTDGVISIQNGVNGATWLSFQHSFPVEL